MKNRCKDCELFVAANKVNGADTCIAFVMGTVVVNQILARRGPISRYLYPELREQFLKNGNNCLFYAQKRRKKSIRKRKFAQGK